MKKVLIISLAFPPVPMVGGLRIAKFCKYLPQLEWLPSVLTQKVKAFREGIDWSMLDGVGDEVKIIRTANFQPFYWWDGKSNNAKINKNRNVSWKCNNDKKKFEINTSLKRKTITFIRQLMTVPDDRLAWIPQAFLPGMRHIAGDGIDVILSSSPSVTNHILGYIISICTGKPHVIDFRDLWSLNEIYPLRGLPNILVNYDRIFEKIILKHSKRIIVVNKTLKKQLMNLYPFLESDKIDVIYNGFDEDELREIKRKSKRNNRFKIVYAGTLYGHRNPRFFLETVYKWINTNKGLLRRIKIEFYSGIHPEYEHLVKNLKLEDVVEFIPKVTRKEILQILHDTDLLLLIHGFNQLSASSTSTKLFEYMATGRPILGLMPESEASEILKKYENNHIVNKPDSDCIIGYLQKNFDKWKKDERNENKSIDMGNEYTRRNQTRQLADILNVIVDKNNQ